MESSIPFVAELHGVREVSIIGRADLSFWTEKLKPENLVPTLVEGSARILFCATNTKFKGVPFRELSISIFVSRRDSENAAFLIHAYNSSRLFALIERTCFSTPYFRAALEVDANIPASVTAIQHRVAIVRAAMGLARQPGREIESGFSGPVFLPGGRRHFHARIIGQTQIFAFDSSQDTFSLSPSAANPVLQWLRDSNFEPIEWHVRPNAIHAKSKTYIREVS